MQRVQRDTLHSRHAALCSNPAAGQLLQHLSRQRLTARPLLPWLRDGQVAASGRRQMWCAAMAAPADGDASDPQQLRPKAKASSPVQPPIVDTASHLSPGAGAGPGAAGVGPAPGAQSYSNFYKSQNTKFYQPSSNGSAATPAAPAPPGGAGAAAAAAPAPTVDDVLRQAQDALAAAETTLEAVGAEEGPRGLRGAAAALAGRAAAAWLALRPVVVVSALAVTLVASHAFGLALQWAVATLSALGLAAWSHRRGSLSPSGAVAAAVVGLATLGCSLRLGATLLAFFFASSKLTRFKEELKDGIEDGAKRGGQRDWKQVLCNSGVPTVLAIAYGALAGCLDLPLGALPGVEAWRADLLTLMMGGFLGYYACCCGDTWASELGVLSTDQPRLITTLKPVRRGTNGGVTLLGLSASIAGGLFTGAVFYAAAAMSPTLWVFDLQHKAALAQWRLVPLGLMAGLLGSLIDSFLGATVQFTGYDVTKQKIVGRPGPDVVHISGLPFLSNNLVNLVSASLTSAVTAVAALRMFA